MHNNTGWNSIEVLMSLKRICFLAVFSLLNVCGDSDPLLVCHKPNWVVPTKIERTINIKYSSIYLLFVNSFFSFFFYRNLPVGIVVRNVSWPFSIIDISWGVVRYRWLLRSSIIRWFRGSINCWSIIRGAGGSGLSTRVPFVIWYEIVWPRGKDSSYSGSE